MIRVSNSLLVGRSTGNHPITQERPAYWEKMFRAVWGQALESLEVQSIEAHVPEAQRYSIYDSVQDAEVSMINYFVGGDAGSSARRAQIVGIFKAVFPAGLEPIINAHIAADIKAAAARQNKALNAVLPHESYRNAGVRDEVALNLQGRGYPTLADCAVIDPVDLVKSGASAEEAVNIQTLAARADAQNKAAKAQAAKADSAPKPPAAVK